MRTDTLTLAIIGHLVGDYLLQNDWMALNKKRRGWPCAVHCFLWAWAVCLFAHWGLLPWMVLFVCHFAQDRTEIVRWWMWTIGQRRFMQCDAFDMAEMRVVPGLGPWSVIVVDNVWHMVTLWAVWRWVA